MLVQIHTSQSFVTVVIDRKQNPTLEKSFLWNDLRSNISDLEAHALGLISNKLAESLQEDEEITFKEFDHKHYTGYATKALAKYQTTCDVNFAGIEMAEEILTKRGETFESRVPSLLAQLRKAKSKKAQPKRDPERKLLKQYTDEELQAILGKCRENKGRIATFTCKKYGSTPLTGNILGARLDKRSGFIQYRIRIQNGDGNFETLGTAWNSPTLKITDK